MCSLGRESEVWVDIRINGTSPSFPYVAIANQRDIISMVFKKPKTYNLHNMQYKLLTQINVMEMNLTKISCWLD
jgi:hypothetical protein